MKKDINSFLSLFSRPSRISFEKRASAAVAAFTRKERVAFLFFAMLVFISTAGLLWKISREFTVEVPARGGSLSEGIVGTPRFINPLLASSDADRDITMLVYSGLLRAANNGVFENDLAKSYEISPDGLTYTFTLKDNLVWHDGEPITADDVVFTIEKAQDATLHSPRRASWDGVKAERVSDTEVRFIIAQPYAPFLENTTMGILPKHLWQTVASEQFGFSTFNIEPVGSGPYKIQEIKKDNAGIPQYYDLVPFKKFASDGPYISTIRVRFYSNVDTLMNAFDGSEIEAINSISPEIAKGLSERYRIEQTPLPRVFGIFFNQNQAKVFADKEVRRALDTAIDKERLVNDILYGYGTAIDSPVPPGTIGYDKTGNGGETETALDRIARARGILESGGWKFDEKKGVMVRKTKKETQELAFTISTSEIPELKEVAEALKTEWEKLGARVKVNIFEIGSLNQNVIRPRKYDALLFGEIVGRDSDLFAFWHSSQRLDPGLNIALYANVTTDKLLEDARKITDAETRIKKYAAFEKELRNDIPAVFLYSPDFIYLLPKNIKGVDLGGATAPAERFLDISQWYIATDDVWKIFVKE